MKAFKSLMILMAIISVCIAEIDDIEEQPQPTAQKASPFKPRGTMSSHVHLLSQLSEPNPNVKVSVVFPNYFGKESHKSLLEMALTQGVNERILVAIQNNGNEPIYIKEITGAFFEEGYLGEKPKYVQNLTIDNYEGAVVNPSDTFSIAYDFFAFTSIPAKNYKLIFAVFYYDSLYEYSNVVFNGHVTVNENE